MKKLTVFDIMLLGMTNFALYVGAGNIIFPPFLGLMSGDNVVISAIGFLLTGVGLPVIAAIALARVGGVLSHITSPIGITAGTIAAVVCYLSIGPFYAIPRTTTVAYELAISPFAKSQEYLVYYSIGYFVIVMLFSLYPAKILDTVGKFLSPIKIAALIILCISALFVSYSDPVTPVNEYKDSAFSVGIINGYLTLDTLASLAFGIVIVNAIRSRNVEDPASITKYATISGILAGLGLTFIYVCLFKLGNESYAIASNATNGAEVLSAYVHASFGEMGSIFLAVLIIVACLVTAIGLVCACSAYFSKLTKISYKTYAITFSIFSAFVANLGLTQLIKVSIPLLITVYPLFIVLVITSFLTKFLNNAKLVIAPVATLSLIFGIIDGFQAGGIQLLPDAVVNALPLYSSNLAWLLPCIIVFIILIIIDKVKKA